MVLWFKDLHSTLPAQNGNWDILKDFVNYFLQFGYFAYLETVKRQKMSLLSPNSVKNQTDLNHEENVN